MDKRMRCSLVLAMGLLGVGALGAQPADAPPGVLPDERFKADILLVIAHPDDETALGAYLAKAVFDDKRSVAVVYCNRGTGGGNTRGGEQADAMGAIRDIEARRALSAFGIENVWFLSGRDTPGQDVLRSLQQWRHGTVLEELIRLVRLTRPEVMMTWLPHFVAGENHGDHQAAGVISTEAFDMAGDPIVFPAQVTPARERRDIGNSTEGLHAWQPRKLYFFSDASHEIEAEGPAFDLNAVSPSKKVSYLTLATQLHLPHETQGEVSLTAAEALRRNDLTALGEYVKRFRLIFGKSVVPCRNGGDVFEGVGPGPAAYTPPPGYRPPQRTSVTLELGGPFAFYRDFWAAHGIERVANLVPPEIEVAAGSYLHVPLLLHNNSGDSLTVQVTATLPPGWREVVGSARYRLARGETYPVQAFVVCPHEMIPDRKELQWEASARGRSIGRVVMKVDLVEWALPQ